jgi:hypothetical protein
MRLIIVLLLAIIVGMNGLLLRDPHNEIHRFVFVFVDFLCWAGMVYTIVKLNKEKTE